MKNVTMMQTLIETHADVNYHQYCVEKGTRRGKSMSVTIKDIARASGVGISTVSRVLNGSAAVNKDTKERVLAAVKALNYIPNGMARDLKKGQSHTIALMVKTITNPFFQKIINIMERQMSLRGYSLDIRNVSYGEQEMDMAIREVNNRSLAGVILMGGKFGYTDEEFKRLKRPCVLVTVKGDMKVSESLYSSVIIDDVAESKKAVNYLISQGHRRIGCIYNDYISAVTPNYKRYLGYQMALQENDIAFDQRLVSFFNPGESGYSFGFRAMNQLMERNPDMTAVFSAADVIAIGATKAVLTAGLRIPQDISIIGFDGIEEAEYYTPSLDTIEQPSEQIAQCTVEAMIDMLKGGAPTHRVLESNLIKRGSCTGIE